MCYAPVIAERAKEAGEEERTASCFRPPSPSPQSLGLCTGFVRGKGDTCIYCLYSQ